MAKKKSKTQKRKAELKTRQKNKQVFQDNKVIVNEHKLRISFPYKIERLEYVKALVADFDNMIGV